VLLFPAGQISWSISDRTLVSRARGEAAISIALLFLLCLVPTGAAAQSMKLLSPQAGWLASGNSLYWTNNGGDDWTDITPIPLRDRFGKARLHSTFFRNISEGWAIVSHRELEPVAPPTPQALAPLKTLYTVAHTVNGGASWSIVPLTFPKLPQWIQDAFGGPADLFFLNSLRGWLDVTFAGLSRPGKLLATEDGGKTWKWINSPGFSGPFTFASLRDAWLLGCFGGDKLYVTHDGCKSWQEVSLSPPPDVEATIYPIFQGVPIFQDQQKGYLVVNYYSGPPGTLSKLVVYSTVDRGKTWRPAKTLAAPHEVSMSYRYPFAMVDSTIIVSTTSSPANIRVGSVPLNGGSSDVSASDRGIIGLTFADTANGWVLSTENGLLATHDGGATWKHIGPPRVPRLPGWTAPGQTGPKPNATR